jgi:AraC-like DNA-binding protein
LLHARPAERWTVNGLARQVGTSLSLLGTRFKATLGQPPMHYLASRRMQLAASLLRDGEPAVAAVAARVGYDSEPAFNRAFKRFSGVPPATWRDAVRLRDRRAATV